MVDESETGTPTEVAEVETPKEALVAKKHRAPRRSKAEIEAAAAKSPKIRQKRTPRAEPIPSDADKSSLATSRKTVVKAAATVKPGTLAATPAGIASGEMADLIQLEEENKRLRQALGEKLRTENADLRKRLGV